MKKSILIWFVAILTVIKIHHRLRINFCKLLLRKVHIGWRILVIHLIMFCITNKSLPNFMHVSLIGKRIYLLPKQSTGLSRCLNICQSAVLSRHIIILNFLQIRITFLIRQLSSSWSASWSIWNMFACPDISRRCSGLQNLIFYL